MARLHAADIPLRRARLLQAGRRSCLWLSLAVAIAVPLLHTARNTAERAGPVAWAPATRPAIVGAPWSMSLFGLELFDPLAVLGLLAARALSVPVALGALPVVLLVALLGRYFCSWLCPYALLVGASNAARALLARAGVPLADVKIPPRTAWVVLGVLLAATALAGSQVAAIVYPPSIIHRALWKVVVTGSAGGGALVIGALFLFDTFVSRAGFCRSLCPGGAAFRLLSLRSPARVVRDAPTCTSCSLCDTVCNMGQSPMTDIVDTGCDRCGRCVSSCPTGALDLVLIGGKR